MRREEQEVLPAADQDQEMVDEHEQRRVSPVRASPSKYQSDSDSNSHRYTVTSGNVTKV